MPKMTEKYRYFDAILKHMPKDPLETFKSTLLYSRKKVKIACRVQIRKKKHFAKIVTSLVRVLLKLLLCSCICFIIRKKPLF